MFQKLNHHDAIFNGLQRVDANHLFVSGVNNRLHELQVSVLLKQN